MTAERILTRYTVRACFTCGAFGSCRHREYDVEAAYIEAEDRRAARKPIAPEAARRKGASHAA